MKVVLLKQEEVEFDLKEEKCEKVSHNMFRMLTDYNEPDGNKSEYPKMVVFKSKEEYQAEAHKYNLDLAKEVLINSKGNIFCQLVNETRDIKSTSEENSEANDSTEKNS